MSNILQYLMQQTEEFRNSYRDIDKRIDELLDKLDLIEQLGTENLAHFSLGENRLIAKTSGRTSLKNGDIISFAIDMNHAYFFDPLNGKRIK